MIYREKSSITIKVEDFITDDVTKKILHHQLEAINILKLKRSGEMKKLTEFVITSFKSHFDNRDNEKVKKLNYIMKELKILSRSGKDLANLQVSSNINFVSLVKFYFIN